MKQIFAVLLLIVLVAPGLSSCDKNKLRMEVVKDCTGVYLRNKAGQDFKVCNESMLDAYVTGSKIKVYVDNLDECFGLLEDPNCTDTHVYEGKIEVTKIF